MKTIRETEIKTEWDNCQKNDIKW